MKVLLINSVCGIRSTGRIATDIAQEYMTQGHTCMIAYGRGEVPEKYKSISYRIGSGLDVKLNGLKARFLDNEALNAKKETEKFIEFANNYNPDLLWLHNLHGYYINIELLFNWIKSRPAMKVRWTLHDCWAFTGHCAHFSLIGCEKWKTGCFSCSQSKEYPASFLSDNSRDNYLRKKNAFTGVNDMTIITPSYWLADLVKQSFLKEYPIEVIHNTIDTDVFKPTKGDFREKYSLKDKFIILGVASAWGDKKGLSDFVELSDLLSDDYAVVLVGLTKKQAAKLKGNIVVIERTDSKEELASIYTAADLFLNLTYEDNYPTVNLEAQACGTPCITYRTGGSVESVPEENIIEQGDIQGVITKIKEFRS